MTVPSEILARIIHPPAVHKPVLNECRIRTTADDFLVEEIPAYEPAGSGEHAFLRIEKRGISSPELVSRIMRQLGVPSKDIGLAGQKDRHAVTRQWCSIPRRFAAAADALNSADVQVLEVTFHRNKLKTGHLKGNRFRLVLRNPAGTFTADDQIQTAARLEELQRIGVPNYFGPQRFGHEGNTIIDGLRLLHGKLPKDHWPEAQNRTLRRLALSAVQSAVFNLVTAERVTAGTCSTPLPGDVVIRKEGIKPFLLPENGDPTGLIPAGPMPGPEMLSAAGNILLMEQSALQTLGLKPADFERFAKLTSGVRRKMAEFPADVSTDLTSDGGLVLQFSLTAGTYATVVLREIAAQVIDSGSD